LWRTITSRIVSVSSFDCNDIANSPNSVSLTVTNNSGVSTQCIVGIEVKDEEGPTASCQAITVALDASGTTTVAASAVDNSSTDNCGGGIGLSLSPNTFDCNTADELSVAALTVTDASGNSASCKAVIIARDLSGPAAVCKNFTVNLDAVGQASLHGSDVNNGSSDNCSVSLSVSPNTFDCNSTSPKTVTLTVSEGGNPSLGDSDFIVGSEYSSSYSSWYGPIYYGGNSSPHALYARSSQLVTADELAAYGLPFGAQITSVGYYKSSSATLNGTGDLKFYMKETTATNLSSDTWTNTVAGATQVYSNTTQSIPGTSGYMTFTLNTPYTYLGGNLQIASDWDMSAIVASPPASSSWNYLVAPLGTEIKALYKNGTSQTDVDNLSSYSSRPKIEMTYTYSPGGQDAICTATVIIGDNLPPTAICQNRTVNIGASQSASISASDINNGSTDNCTASGSLGLALGGTTSFTCSHVTSTINVTLTVSDASGNDTDCTADVYVGDNVTPTAICKNATVSLDASGNGTLVPSDVDNNSSDNCSISLAVSPTTFNCATLGTQSATLTATDASGNNNDCVASVTVQDNIAPTASCKNATVSLAANSIASLAPSDVDNNSSDNCSHSLSVSPNTFDCDDLSGTQSVTLTITDGNSQSDNCVASITVTDPLSTCCSAPVAACKQATVSLDATGNYSLSTSEIDNGSTAECGLSSLTINLNSFTCGSLGNHSVTLTITDVNGSSATCSSTVTVEDNFLPTALCKNATVSLDASGDGGILPGNVDNNSSDNCTFSLVVSPNTFDCSTLGGQNVTLTATDASGNSSTCQASIEVEDNILPTAYCHSTTVSLDVDGNYSLLPREVDNNSSDVCSLTMDVSPNTFGCSHTGAPQTVTLTATDASGNTSNCTAGVIVTDVTAPEINCNLGLPDQVQAVVTVRYTINPYEHAQGFTVGRTGDMTSIGIDITTVTPGDISLQVYVGTNPYSLGTPLRIVTQNPGTITDSLFNFKFSSPIPVQVGDQLVFVVSGITGIYDIGLVGGNVYSGGYGYSNYGRGFYPNSAFLTFTTYVTVPYLAIELDVNGLANLDAGDIYSGAWDVCGLGSLGVSPSAFDCNDINNNPHIVTLSALDIHNNSSSCTAEIRVEDNIAPTVFCQDVTVELDAGGNASIVVSDIDNGTTDNCNSMANPSFNMSQSNFDCNDLAGIYALAFDGVDDEVPLSNNSNPANLGNQFTVEAWFYVEDKDINTHKQVIIKKGGSSRGFNAYIYDGSLYFGRFKEARRSVITTFISTHTINEQQWHHIALIMDGGSLSGYLDGVLIQNVSAVSTGVYYNNFSLGNGETRFHDGAITTSNPFGGKIDEVRVWNEVLTQSQIVQYMMGPIAGNDTRLAAYYQMEDGPGSSVLSDGTVNGFDGSLTNMNPNTAWVSGLPILSIPFITLTVTDASGNSSQCNALVIIEDNIVPTASCQPVTVNLDSDGKVSLVASELDNNSINNCDIAFSASPNTFDCSHVSSTQTVTLTVTDPSSNSDQCTAAISVEDNSPPIPSCQGIAVVLDASGSASILASEIDAGSSDACGSISMSVSQAVFYCSDISASPVTTVLTITDAFANTSTCTAEVSVSDNMKPTALCQPYTLALDATGNGSLMSSHIDAGSSDNCGLHPSSPFSLSKSSIDCADAPTQLVSLTVTDLYGNMDQCTAAVTIDASAAAPILDPISDINTCSDLLLNIPTFSANPSSAVSSLNYSYSFLTYGISASSTGQVGTISLPPNTTGSDIVGTVNFSVTGSNGCVSDEESFSITVHPKPSGITATGTSSCSA